MNKPKTFYLNKKKLSKKVDGLLSMGPTPSSLI